MRYTSLEYLVLRVVTSSPIGEVNNQKKLKKTLDKVLQVCYTESVKREKENSSNQSPWRCAELNRREGTNQSRKKEDGSEIGIRPPDLLTASVPCIKQKAHL